MIIIAFRWDRRVKFMAFEDVRLGKNLGYKKNKFLVTRARFSLTSKSLFAVLKFILRDVPMLANQCDDCQHS